MTGRRTFVQVAVETAVYWTVLAVAFGVMYLVALGMLRLTLDVHGELSRAVAYAVAALATWDLSGSIADRESRARRDFEAAVWSAVRRSRDEGPSRSPSACPLAAGLSLRCVRRGCGCGRPAECLRFWRWRSRCWLGLLSGIWSVVRRARRSVPTRSAAHG